jgi:hypothetical protein
MTAYDGERSTLAAPGFRRNANLQPGAGEQSCAEQRRELGTGAAPGA